MLQRRRQLAVPLLLGAAAFALSFAQRPGLATADTKINLHVDPGRFLGDVASMWTSTGQLGDVQTGQQAGYLFPMGPFFALGHLMGLSDWVVQRLWLGTLLALAAWGVVRLLDALLSPSRGIAHLTAGGVTLLNPFVVTYVNRTTVTLLAYAALPWLLLAVHRGLRAPRGWRWPAAAALLIAASGGGINGAVTAWMLLGPLLLALYELLFAGVGWAAARQFLVRALPLILLASLWWLIPAYVQSSYGIDFLHFTEQPGTVWGTTSITESLRLMSFWLSYVGIGFAGRAIPYFDDSRTLLFSAPVVLGTLLIPAAALGGFVWTRRWRYGPFFLALALIAVLVMGAGFPDGTPLRHGLTFTYNHFAAVRFLRASYKAAPLLALALACLAGGAAAQAWRRLGALPRAVAWRTGATAAGLVVLALSAWPLVTGRAQDRQVSFKRIPLAWRRAAADLDRQLPANARAMVLPGDLFSFYTWGGTVDPIFPVLSRRPVAERSEVPYGDLRATDLLWTIDALVHQRRLLPGQLAPLLGLAGIRSVLTGTDDDLARSDAPPPADMAAELAAQAGFALPAHTYGSVRRFEPTGLGAAVALAQVRRYDLPSSRGIVRLEPAAAPIVVDGSASGVAELAAFGGLAPGRALLYAGDLNPAALRATLAGGGKLVISDSNRRRAFVAASLEQNTGPTLTAEENVSANGLVLDPFGRGPGNETVASYAGIRAVSAPSSPERPQFPEHRPFAALDGSPTTAWLADPTLDPGRRWLEVDFSHPRAVPYVDLLPYDDAGATVTAVQLAGRNVAVRRGWNRIALGLRRVSGLRVSIAAVSGPVHGAVAGAGGISELRIPGVRASEHLRLPLDSARALLGAHLGNVSLSYLFERTTGDDPFQRDPVHGPWSAFNVHAPGDAEQTIDRLFELPATRRFTASAWVSVFAGTSDATLDRLAGYRGPVSATSSSRVEGEPQWRASRALDRNPRTAWIGDYVAGNTWLQWQAPRLERVSALRLIAPLEPVRRPTLVRISWPGGVTMPLRVGPRGLVVLPHALSTRALRIDVLGASAPRAASAADRRAVGIAEVRGVSGLPPVTGSPSPRITAPCGAVRVATGGGPVALRVTGSAAAFEAGRPLRAEPCGRPVLLTAGMQELRSQPGAFAVDDLELSSPVPYPQARPSGRVLDSGRMGRGSYDHVRVAVARPSWLVLGEGYNRGWRASCDGRSLGQPTPIDGYANGWRVAPGCHEVQFQFAPNRLAAVGYVVSLVAGALCLLLLLAAALRRQPRRWEAPRDEQLTMPAGGRIAPWARPHALAASLLTAIGFGFVFGIAAGVVCVPVLALILRRGVGAAALSALAGLLLGVVVPVLYLAHPGDEHGGNHFSYATTHIVAHWVGVAAVGLLMVALWRTLAASRSPRPGRQAPAAPPQAAVPAA